MLRFDSIIFDEGRKYSFELTNKKVLLMTVRIDNKIECIDCFKAHPFIKIALHDKNSDSYFRCSPYLGLLADNLIESDNLDCAEIKKSFNLQELHEILYTDTLHFCLQVLLAYDKTKRQDLLDLAQFLYEYIENNYELSSIDIVNKLQIKKRFKALTDEDKEILISLKNTITDISLMCAINILLDSITEFNICFKKLSLEEQTRFKNFPIYNLA